VAVLRTALIVIVVAGDRPDAATAGDSPASLKVLLSGSGKWESAPHGEGNIYAPHVIRDGKTLRMLYGGQGVDGHDRIMYAESRDGRRWTRKGGVIDNGTSNHVNDPCIVVVDGRYFMFYTRADKDVVDQIDVATAGNGQRPKHHGVALAPGKKGAWDSLLVGRPAVIYEDGLFRMWYDGRKDLSPGSPATGVPKSPTSTRSVGYATSRDGLRWTRYEGNPVFHHDAGAVDVKRFGDRLVMLYESREGTRLASSRDGTHWTNHGLLAAKSGRRHDAYGHVTPFLLIDPDRQVHELYVGASAAESWDRNAIGVIRITNDELERKLSVAR